MDATNKLKQETTFANESDTGSSIEKYDEAYGFLRDQDSIDNEDDEIELKNLIRRIDYRIVTLLSGIYFLQFLDKSLLNYAGVMGIKDNLKGNEFSNLGTILYIAYIFPGEPLAAYLFQVYKPAKVFSAFVICWGIVVTLHVVCHNYASLMVIRALLGFFESCVAPGCIAITGMWWTKDEQVFRMGLWSTQAGTATIIGGLLSYAFQFVNLTNPNFQAYHIFFLFMGLITVFFGILVLILLPDNPTSAKFLNSREKMLILEHIRKNQTGTENKVFKKDQLMELLFRDKHTWPMVLLTLMSMVATGALGTFGVTVIASFGYTNKVSALVQMPVGVSVIITIVGGTYLCSKYGHRTLISAIMIVLGIIGYIVLLSCKNKIGKLISLYLINPGTCIITMIYSWNSTNTAGYTKRLARNCLTMIAFAVGSLIGPQLFRVEDAPNYTPAKITLLVLNVACLPLLAWIAYISKTENGRRDEAEQQEMPENYEFLDLTDIENPNFRYSY